GNLVELRKANSALNASLAQADSLFSLAANNPQVTAQAFDNGVAVINYLDTGGGNVFPNPRDVGTPPLTVGDHGTFAAFAEDDNFAMKSSGFIFIPAAGDWTFSTRSDDGERLEIGTDNAVVTIFDGARTPATDSTAVTVPRPGYYHYQLTWDQRVDGAMAD